MADGGTLFMDEVAELELNMQVKLLRAIEGGGYTPIGSREIKNRISVLFQQPTKILKDCVEKGDVREDFYYRIHIIPITIPPLRERKEDISLLLYHFLHTYCDEDNIPSIPEDIIKSMQSYDWPGNVRELQNAIHRYITLKEIDFLDISQSKPAKPEIIAKKLILENNNNLMLRAAKESFEKKYLEKLLHEHQWAQSQGRIDSGYQPQNTVQKDKNVQDLIIPIRAIFVPQPILSTLSASNPLFYFFGTFLPLCQKAIYILKLSHNAILSCQFN